MSNVARHPFGMVMEANYLMEVFFSDGGCFGRVTGPSKEVVVIETVVGMVQREVLTNLWVLMEVGILVLLMIRAWMWRMVVGVAERVLQWVVKEMLVWGVEGLMRGIVAGSLGLSESSGKDLPYNFPFFLEFLPNEGGCWGW